MPFSLPIALCVFGIGAIVGSFLNVLIYRTIRGKDWVNGRSRCEFCRKLIPWYENIPLFSYLFLRGRCSGCNKPIDLIHPAIEFLTGALFLWWYAAGYLFFTLTSSPLQVIQPAFWLLVVVVCVAIWISDWRYMLIPRWTVVVLTGATLLYRLVLLTAGEMQLADFGWSLVWAGVVTAFFFSLWWYTKGKGFGFGDVQLVFPLALLMGTGPRIVVGIFVAFFIGAVTGIVMIIARRKKFRQAIPFGPFLLLGTVIGLLWGYELWAGYVRIITG